MFLGLLMFGFGALPQEPQPIPIWVWRTLSVVGVVLALSAAAAKYSRANLARILAMFGLAATAGALGILLVYSVLQRRFNPFTLLLAGGAAACVKGILFYGSDEIKALFGVRPPPP